MVPVWISQPLPSQPLQLLIVIVQREIPVPKVLALKDVEEEEKTLLKEMYKNVQKMYVRKWNYWCYQLNNTCACRNIDSIHLWAMQIFFYLELDLCEKKHLLKEQADCLPGRICCRIAGPFFGVWDWRPASCWDRLCSIWTFELRRWSWSSILSGRLSSERES